MDVLSHGLWAIAAGKGARLESPNKLQMKWLFWWGIFPDMFAFTPIFIVRILASLTGQPFFERPINMYEPWTPNFSSLSNATQYLYQISHSLIIFTLVVLIVYLVSKKIPWVMLGWPLHILADIPTHSTSFYATPAFWPLWDVKFNGFSWGAGHFTIYNYAALAVVFALLYFVSKTRQAKSNDVRVPPRAS